MTGTFDRAVGTPVTPRPFTAAMRRTAPLTFADNELLDVYSSSRPSFHFTAAAAAAAAYNDDECSLDQLLLLNPIQVRLILTLTTFTTILGLGATFGLFSYFRCKICCHILAFRPRFPTVTADRRQTRRPIQKALTLSVRA